MPKKNEKDKCWSWKDILLLHLGEYLEGVIMSWNGRCDYVIWGGRCDYVIWSGRCDYVMKGKVWLCHMKWSYFVWGGRVIMSYEVDGVRGRGRPRMTWSVEGHERTWFEKGGCAGAREVEETAVGSHLPTPCVSGGNGCKTIVVLYVH